MKEHLRLFLDRHQGAPRAVDWGSADTSSAAPMHAAGIRGWLGRKSEHFKTRWHESRTGLTGKMHRLWDWMHKRTPPDEPLLAGFRKSHRIDVFHPDSLSPEEARLLWGVYLSRRRRRHLPRLALNLVVAPLTVLLIPLPGPNLVGYWFAYRAIHHMLILHGLRKARKEKLAVSFHPINDHAHELRAKPIGELEGTHSIGDDFVASREPPAGSAAGASDPASARGRHDS